MKLPQRISFKLYFLVFLWIALSGLVTLTVTGTDPYVYYHTMMAFHKKSAIFYDLAIANAILTTIAIVPVALYAFGAPHRGAGFFQSLFLARVVLDLLGKNYEWQFIKTAFLTSPLAGAATLLLPILLLWPSYLAHYRYAFSPKTD